MKYTDLIRKIKNVSGAREDESKDALEVVVEHIATNLTDYTRKGFAARLPKELQDAAQTEPTMATIDEDIVDQYMDIDDIDEHHARQTLRAAWLALTEQFDPESVEDITAELPPRVKTVLY